MALAALADAATDVLVARRTLAFAALTGAPAHWSSRPILVPLALDAALLVLAIPTRLGSKIALVVGIAAFASRFGLRGERTSWTLIYGVVATWLLATHFFALGRPRR